MATENTAGHIVGYDKRRPQETDQQIVLCLANRFLRRGQQGDDAVQGDKEDSGGKNGKRGKKNDRVADAFSDQLFVA